MPFLMSPAPFCPGCEGRTLRDLAHYWLNHRQHEAGPRCLTMMLMLIRSGGQEDDDDHEQEDEGNVNQEDNDVDANQEARRMTVMMEMLVMNNSEGTSTLSLFCL